ncbi:MAG: ABC transporter substrate-binding protein [Caulobacteraceae bacterium]
MRFTAAFVLTLALASPPALAMAQSDAAAAKVQSFYDTLLDTMKQGKSLGVDGRYRKMEPAVEQTFDLPVMTRFAVGTKWSSFSLAEQAQLVKSFSRMSVATYAKNFDSYGGQSFTVDPNVQTRGADKLVKTLLNQKGKAPIELTYRMRGTKIIDVYYKGSVSQLTTQRSDFSATAASGAAALVKKIDALSDSLMGK